MDSYFPKAGAPFRLPRFDLRHSEAKTLMKSELIDMLANLYSFYCSLADECSEVIEEKEILKARVEELEEQLNG